MKYFICVFEDDYYVVELNDDNPKDVYLKPIAKAGGPISAKKIVDSLNDAA